MALFKKPLANSKTFFFFKVLYFADVKLGNSQNFHFFKSSLVCLSPSRQNKELCIFLKFYGLTWHSAEYRIRQNASDSYTQ